MTIQPNVPGRIPEWSQGDYLRKARVSAGLTARELAELTGMSEKTINNYESERVKPRRPGLIAWALATGVDFAWLETGNAPRPDGPEGGERACRDSNPKPSDSERGPAQKDTERDADVVVLPDRRQRPAAA